jgi:hypothetical protein
MANDLLPNRTYLIQRLNEPAERKGKALVNPFSFGAGYSGLEQKTEETLAGIFSFDYMGAAQFEDGIVQRALKSVSEYFSANYFATGTCYLPDEKEVYYLCRKEDEKGVKKTIEKLYSNERSFYLKEPTWLKQSLNEEDFLKDRAGWLELNNNFIFFKDKKMYKRILELFIEHFV